ncbi:hypothetical protein C1I98_06285 [Spongiactinospora gelatinilytica]|uniref:DNA-binding response regulator n=1 Tax=Spongiactinospora gelatinilytica TaxID=2666298 RepID=A0A2W2ITH0_9ACTN|nr:hypothetical protein C1I98_06285 [Spongiactinospora gelatinilytica]
MGGALDVPGNVHQPGHDGSAEWNIHWDPGAAQRVLDSGVPDTMFPLDVTELVPITGEFALAFGARCASAPPVLVLTTFDNDTLVLDAIRAGACGYLLKDVTLERLTRAIRVIAAGGTLISPSITDRLLRAVHRREGPAGEDLPPVQRLTERELEVLLPVAEGYSNREIAQALFLAEGTVKNHVSTVLLELGARDRTNAVLRALHENVLDRLPPDQSPAACRAKAVSMSVRSIAGPGRPVGPSTVSAFRNRASCRSAARGQSGPCARGWVRSEVKTIRSVAFAVARTLPSARPRSRKASRWP